MKICVYSPYIPKHIGGGEKYILDVARVLAEKHQVSVAISGQTLSDSEIPSIRKKYEDFLGESLARISFIPTPLGTNASFLKKLWWTSDFDVLYYLTDGSLFFSLAGKNILHIQIPFTDSKNTLLDRIKLDNWTVKNTNSKFTKQIVEHHWQTKIGYVHYPLVKPVSVAKKKQPIILHVGRFFRQLHSKRQDVLVDIFHTLVKRSTEVGKKWKLVLVGGVEDQAYVTDLKKLGKKASIEFHHELSRSQLEKIYGEASIYWHATGYDVDEQKHPEKMEHFGISTVEAMSAGCAPVVIGKGGQSEIMAGELAKWTWQTKEECVEKTLALIQQPSELKRVRDLAETRAKDFGLAAFTRTLEQMIES